MYYTFWRASGAGPSTSYPAGTHMSPGEQGSGVCAKSGVLKQARRAPTAGFERAKNRSRQSTKASKRFGRAAGFLLASARDLRFSPGAIQQGNVGLLGTQNGITRSAARRVKTPDLVLSYTDPVLKCNSLLSDAHGAPCRSSRAYARAPVAYLPALRLRRRLASAPRIIIASPTWLAKATESTYSRRGSGKADNPRLSALRWRGSAAVAPGRPLGACWPT